ncbi:MAG: SigB/SigF/SigG family RNA polymerase sigma factor [Thermoleophilia bacterium]
MNDAERERLIVEHLPLVRALASRYAHRGESFEDLVQVATIGLIKAIDRFDARRGPSLVAFATPTILGEIRRHFRDTSWAVHVPRSITENRTRVARVIDELTAARGRSPSVREIAAAADLSEEEVLDALAAESARSAMPIAGPGPDAEDDPAAQVGADDAGFGLAETRADLADGLARLPARERAIVHLRFTEDLTQSEIAARLGISQMHVSRLLRRALDVLREAAEEGGSP